MPETPAPKMKPLPKSVGYIALLASIAATASTFGDILPPRWAAVIATIGTILTSLTHSLQGTGGSLQNP